MTVRVIVRAAVCVSAILGMVYSRPVNLLAADAPRMIDSRELENTVFTPLLQSEIEPGKNLLYCATFQVAWNEFIDTVIREPVIVEGDLLLVRMLNKKFGGSTLIPGNSSIAAAGFEGEGTVERIRSQSPAKFRTDPLEYISPGEPGDSLVYACLRKECSFGIEFEKLPRALLFNNDDPVRAFGIQRYTFDVPHQDLAAQVAVFSYNNENDFVIGLKPRDPDDEIILAKMKPRGTLLETVNQVILRVSSPYPTALFEGETVQIPGFDFEIIHYFSELMNKRLLNREFDEKNLDRMIQTVRFKLNEKGPLLSTDAVSGKKTPMTLETEPRRFVFDAPFLLIIRQKPCPQPYFVMWVENTELMCK